MLGSRRAWRGALGRRDGGVPSFGKRDRLLTRFQQLVDRPGGRWDLARLLDDCLTESGLPRHAVPLNRIAVVADGQLVPLVQRPLDDADTVNTDAIGAAEIADDEVIADLGD